MKRNQEQCCLLGILSRMERAEVVQWKEGRTGCERTGKQFVLIYKGEAAKDTREQERWVARWFKPRDLDWSVPSRQVDRWTVVALTDRSVEHPRCWLAAQCGMESPGAAAAGDVRNAPRHCRIRFSARQQVCGGGGALGIVLSFSHALLFFPLMRITAYKGPMFWNHFLSATIPATERSH
ncbi:hypothetical protein B0H65DRAFT_220425 [Neurospora tetraspora]|uniref:Uncharacterized protein n=1 Tax=Neurospora tetraspora TaxID=94610 RepID=A0AAE0JCW7_9PEZI|nr:hypothetical protein B0H65DRAFT_220425 [Neurospora tetraspora]